MYKKFSVFYFLSIFLICIGVIFGVKPKNNVAFAEEVNVTSKSAILVDANSGEVLYNKNELERLPIASMCKIMTMLICFENIDNGNLSLDEEITVSERASSMGGSQVFLRANEKYKVFELLKSISVASANDSCVALAEKLYGSEEEFVCKMNKKCEELSLLNTKFSNCTGLPKPEQYSCALDVSKMFSELIKHPKYFEISNIWMQDFVHPDNSVTQMANTNKLIRFYNGCDSGKTGFTSEAGHCLTASAKRNGLRLVSVVIKAPNSKTRFAEVSNMLNYGFNNFESKKIIDSSKNLDLQVAVEKGKKDKIEVCCENDVSITIKKGQSRNFEFVFEPSENIKAPVKIGEIVGKLNVYENGVLISSVNVLSNEEVLRKTYFDVIKDAQLNWNII